MLKSNIIVVRGAGDIATGIIWMLSYAGYKVICLDIANPSCIRREVSFSEAVYDDEKIIEGIKCIKAKDVNEAINIVNNKNVALLIDEKGESIKKINPDILVDAILAKKNIGTNINMANCVIAVGPGFTVGVNCHYAIETMRGHKLGYIYESGSPIPNTGVPGLIAGASEERVIHTPTEGIFKNKHKISDIVKKDDVIAEIEEYINGNKNNNIVNVYASIDGVLRGIIHDGYYVNKGLKCADIDPRISEVNNCFSISDKARSIGGSVVTLATKYFLCCK